MMINYEQLFPAHLAAKIESTKTPAGKLTLQNNGKLPLEQSKVGGVGYFPEQLIYPKNEDGEPLQLIAQLNFEELPEIPNFPTRGILAFYIDIADALYGMDLADLTNKSGYRCYYFEDVTVPGMTREMLETLLHEKDRVAQSEYAIDCSVVDIPCIVNNYEFETAFQEEYFPFLKKLFGKEFDEKLDIVDNHIEELMGHGLIGGHPIFTQQDPRTFLEDLQQDVLLFQLDSVYNDEQKINVMWGDMGVANFFIHPEDLKNRLFDNVWFTWDN